MDNPAGLVPRRSRTAFQRDGGQLPYHRPRHPDTLPAVSAIARNTVRDQSGMGVRDQWNAQPGTGKTAFGRHIAQSLDRPLLVKRASDILSP